MKIFVRRSALKHGISAEDSLHVVRNPELTLPLEDDPPKVLFLGFDTRGRTLEVIVVEDEGDLFLIHSMKIRAKYERLLTGRRNDDAGI